MTNDGVNIHNPDPDKPCHLISQRLAHPAYLPVQTLGQYDGERILLSLDKTKEVEEPKRFLGDQKALLSWKLDGLTIVLTYRGACTSEKA